MGMLEKAPYGQKCCSDDMQGDELERMMFGGVFVLCMAIGTGRGQQGNACL